MRGRNRRRGKHGGGNNEAEERKWNWQEKMEEQGERKAMGT